MRRVIFLIMFLGLFAASNSYGALTVSPTSKDFGDVMVGNSSSFTFPISNTGSTDVTITGVVTQGDTTSFKLKSTTCTGVLTHGHNCSAEVTFSPLSIGSKSAKVQIVSSGGSPTANLSGTGVCGYSLNPMGAPSIGYCGTGGGMSISVLTQSGCAWSATSNVSWITITSGSSGSGEGTVIYKVAKNYDPNPRTGTMTIAGLTFTAIQVGCPNSLSSTSASFCPEGGTGSVDVAAGAECCVWDAASDASWITITNITGRPSSNGTVSYSVSTNPGPGSRTGTMTIAGLAFTVTQATPTSLSPSSRSHGSGAGTGDIGVIATSGCSWTATRNNSWITITSGSSGSGNGTVNYSISTNPGPGSRTGTITVAGMAFTVNQAAPSPPACIYSITPPSASFTDSGGMGSVAVTGNLGCTGNPLTWAATSNDNWITITSGSTGYGNGTVNYSVTANLGPGSRTGTLTIAGQTFTVTQEAPIISCVYTLLPASRDHGSGEETGSVAVTESSGCTGNQLTWAAKSNDSWITITSGSTGYGNGTVNYSVSANPAGFRTGTMAIAGQTFTVNQGIFIKACTYKLSVGIFPTEGGTATKDPDKGLYCQGDTVTLTAIPSPEFVFNTWYGVDSSNGIVATVTMNADKSVAASFLIICTSSILPASRDHGPRAEKGNVTVTIPSGCDWTAVSNDSWLTITSGNNENRIGNGTVNYEVMPNANSDSRSGTLTIAGQTFTVKQAGLGNGWATVTPPIMNTDWGLEGVHFTSSDEGWAVGGDYTDPTRAKGMLLHYSGGVWTSETPPSESGGYMLNGVDLASASEGWAVGGGDLNSRGDILFKYSGGSWTSVIPGSVSSTNVLLGVCLTSPYYGWAVGKDVVTLKGVLLQWSRTPRTVDWVSVDPPPISSNWALLGVHFSTDDEGWAVGVDHENTKGVLLHYSWRQWTSVASPPDMSLNWQLIGVHFTSPEEGWAVGTDFSNKSGIILHYSGTTWANITPPPVSADWTLEAVHFTSPEEGWAVGTDFSNKSGIILHYSGTTWTNITPPPVSADWTLESVHFSSPYEGWAVGRDKINKKGVFVQFNAVSMETVSPPWKPTGPGSGNTGASYSFTTGGAVSSLNHPVEYQFDWDWGLSPWGDATQSYIWPYGGTYHVRARARCKTDAEIVSPWSEAITVDITRVPAPDLTGQWVSFTPSCKKGSKGVQCSLKGSFKVQNTGDKDVSTSFDVSFYLSDDDSILSGPDTLLKQVVVKGLKTGPEGSKPIHLNVTLPSQIDAGTKYVLAFVDSKDVVWEPNERNNVIPFPNCSYLLTIDVKPSGAGWVTRSPSRSAYCSGEKVTLTANANSRYGFGSWVGVDSSNGATATLTMNGDLTVTANFRDITSQPCHSTLTITVNPLGSGTVIEDPVWPTYCPKDKVTLTPDPIPGYVLDSWEGTDSNTLVTTVTMKNSREVKANFVPAPKVKLDVQLMSDGTGGNFSNCETPNKKESFLPSDPFAVLYLKFLNIPTYSTMSYSFFKPDGGLYEPGSQDWYDSSKCGYVCWAPKLLIAGHAALSIPGLWWVYWTYDDGVNNLSGSQPFKICRYSISPSSRISPFWGGTGSVDVQATSVCGWTAVSNVPWITITSRNTEVMGNGTVNYSVLANPGSSSRTGTLTIAGQSFTLSQGANWNPVALPILLTEWDLRAVTFPSPDEGWAVGGDDIYHEGILLHYSGGGWTSVVPPTVSGHWHLYGVHFPTPEEGWAVGEDIENHRGVLFHYSEEDGTWNNVSPPAMSDWWNLNGIWLPPDVSDGWGWAVGSSTDDPSNNSKGILLYNPSGDAWVPFTPPWVSTLWSLHSVHFSSPAEGWAVGDGIVNYKVNGVLLRYDCLGLMCDTGVWWTNVSPPSLSADYWVLNSVYSILRDEAWAVGLMHENTTTSGVLLHNFGGVWSLEVSPWVSTNWTLNSVYFSSPEEGWAVGSDVENQRGVLLHYSGEQWTSVIPPSVSGNWGLYGVHFPTPEEGWAVGEDYENHRGVLLHLAPVPTP
jgi:hypothetical protein